MGGVYVRESKVRNTIYYWRLTVSHSATTRLLEPLRENNMLFFWANIRTNHWASSKANIWDGG